MGAERCIVLLVVVVMGTGFFVVNSVVDENILKNYSEEVAAYNDLHDETLLDTVMHKKSYSDSDENGKHGIDHKYGRVERSSGQGMNYETEHTWVDKSSGQGMNEDPEHTRVEISSAQDIKDDAEHNRKERSSGQGVDENPEYTMVERSSGQDMFEDPKSNHEGDVEPKVDSSVFETASNLDESDEDVNGMEEDEDISLIALLMKAATLSDSGSDEQYGISEDGNYRDVVGHYDVINPSAYQYELQNADSEGPEVSSSQIGYYSLYKADNDDERIIKLNKGVDFILGLMRTMFTGESELTVDLPDINKKFGHGIMAGNFNAIQGYFRNPATLRRTGDVAITKLGDTVSLEVALGLQTLEAGFQHYDLKILKIHQAGNIDVSVVQNSIKMKISLTYAPACNLTVNYVGLDQLDGIKLSMTGLGTFQSMFDMLSKWFLDNFTEDFKRIVNEKLAEKARKAVAREDICEYFPQ